MRKRRKNTNRSKRGTPVVENLEPRVLFSADFPGLDAAIPSTDDLGDVDAQQVLADAQAAFEQHNTDSGWDRQHYDFGSTDYAEGGYLISIATPDQMMWANPGLAFKDVSVEVETVWLDGGDDNNLGIICRYQDVANFYALMISSDGYYGIRRALSGYDTITFIGSTGMQQSDVINMNGHNQLRADCIGSTLSLYANGELLMQVEDNALAYGDVGLIAGTFGAESTEILFKNLVVYLP